jgi:hypothetical protein
MFSTWQHRSRTAPLAKIDRLRRLAWLIDAIGRVPGTRFRFGLNSVSIDEHFGMVSTKG